MIELAIAAKRYDGGSGTATFTGVIPLKPGQLVESDLGLVSLWNGGTEIGCTASALWPQHPDGSVKIVRVSTTLTLAAGVQQNLSLVLGVARQVSGPTEPVITGAWVKNPRLIGCTDAAHLCSSHVAPLPLVPIPHPNLPARWNAFLTTQFDDPATAHPSWGRMKAEVMADGPNTHGGTANYNGLSALYYKYLTSGELDRLNEAHHTLQYEGGFPIGLRGMAYCAPGRSRAGNAQDPGASPNGPSAVVWYGESYQGHAADSLFQTEFEGWSPLLFQPYQQIEWYSGVFMDLYLGYCLSGWQQPLGILVAEGLSKLASTTTGAFPALPDANPYSWYGGRFQWRLIRSADVMYYLLSPPMSLYFSDCYNLRVAAPSPRTNKPAWQQWVRTWHFDIYEAWGQEFTSTYAPSGVPIGSLLDNTWMGRPNQFTDFGQAFTGAGWVPNFQFQLLWIEVMVAYLNVVQDSRVKGQMITLADRLFNQRYSVNLPDPEALAPGQPNELGYQLFYPFYPTPQGGSGYWGHTQLLMLYTWAWRATGDSKYLQIADLHCSNTHSAIAGGGRAGSAGWKEFGETYPMAFHAAAYRAGVPWDGWDIDGEVEPPPSGEIMATLNTSITLANQEHSINYTGMRVRFQRSTDGGVTWADVQSNVRALGTTADSYNVLTGQAGQYRAGATLTDGTQFSPEVFSNIAQVAVFEVLTPQTITLSIA